MKTLFHRKTRKSSFLLIEIIISMALTMAFISTSVVFYKDIQKRSEENIVELQIPLIVEKCYFDVQETILKNFPQNVQVFSSEETLYTPLLYNSKGHLYRIPYTYHVVVKKVARQDTTNLRQCLADVTLELFPNDASKQMSYQRTLYIEEYS